MPTAYDVGLYVDVQMEVSQIRIHSTDFGDSVDVSFEPFILSRHWKECALAKTLFVCVHTARELKSKTPQTFGMGHTGERGGEKERGKREYL